MKQPPSSSRLEPSVAITLPQPLLPLICVGGPSAAGKSQLSAQLAAALRSQGINPLPIACDDYYRCGWSGDGPYGFDTPAAIDSELLIQQLHAVRQGGLPPLRTYDMATRTSSWRQIQGPYEMVLLEGAYGLQQVLQQDDSALLIYIDVPQLQRLMRRLKRDVRQRQRQPLRVIRQMLGPVRRGEREFITPLKAMATVVLKGNRDQLSKVMPLIPRIQPTTGDTAALKDGADRSHGSHDP